MKAPDKIYMPEGFMHAFMLDNPNPLRECVEYIRKDALLEWAKNMKRICKGAEPIEKAYQTIINKIESL